jgi:hypothetical protein
LLRPYFSVQSSGPDPARPLLECGALTLLFPGRSILLIVSHLCLVFLGLLAALRYLYSFSS